jgi:hypothetical protein
MYTFFLQKKKLNHPIFLRSEKQEQIDNKIDKEINTKHK